MNETETVCPYCNAVLPPRAAPPNAEMLPCPRCGELLPKACWRVETLASAIQAGSPPLAEPREPVPGVRNTAYVVLGVMLTMAIIGLCFALWTVNIRRARDPWMPNELKPIAARRPVELSGLGLLPRNSQIVAGLHIAEMMDDEKVGKKLLAEPRPALLDWSVKQITRTTGMELKDIDHVVLGIAIDANFPQLVMIVKARNKISLEAIAEARPTRSALHQDQPYYVFPLNPIGEALLWRVDDQTIVCVARLDAVNTQHLNGLSLQARPVDDVLPATLQKTMAERLPKHNFLWTAGQLDQLGAAKDVLPLLLGGKMDLSNFKDMQSFALGIAPVEGLTMTGHFRTTDAKASARFKAMLDDVKFEGAASQKVEATPPEVAEQWVTWQVRGDVATVRGMLGGGQEGKK